MADKIVSATLKVNTGTAASDVNEVNKSLADTGKTLGATNKAAETTTESFGSLKEGLGKLPGPLKSVGQGVDSVSASLKALLANPVVLVITAIVTVLYTLYKAFASTEEGAEKIQQVMSGLSAVLTVLRDRFLKLAEATAEFFSGNFKLAAQDAKDAFSGIGAAAVNAYSTAAQAQKAFQEATDDYNRRIAVNRAKLNKDLAASRELITDETASYKDRVKAIEEVRTKQAQQEADEIKSAQTFVDIAQSNLDRDKQSAQYRDDLAAAQEKLSQVQQQAAQDERNLNRQNRQIESAEKAKHDAASKASTEAMTQQEADKQTALKKTQDDLKAVTDAWTEYVNSGIANEQKLAEARKKQNEADQKEIDDYTKKQNDADNAIVDKKLNDAKAASDALAAFQEKTDSFNSPLGIASVAKGFANRIDALTKYYSDAKKVVTKGSEDDLKLTKAYQDAKTQIILSAASQGLKAIANILGQQTVAGKAAAIASTTIDTYQSAIASYKALAGIPVIGPGLGFVAAGLAVANGLATVKQIASVKVPGAADGSGAGNISNPLSGAAPIAPTTQQVGTSIDPNSIQGIGNAVSGRNYVLSQDIDHDKDRNERLNRASRLGG
jgi:hypothetical protein